MKKFMLILISFVVISLVFFPLISYLSAQPPWNLNPCDREIKDRAAPGDAGYQKRSDSMCEGVYTVPRSGEPSLEMVSLTQGDITFNLEVDKQLYVDIPGLDKIRERPIHIQAVGREEGVHYRMDAFMPPKGSFIWSLETVLAKEGIEDFMLGVYGWIDNLDHQIFLPIAISTEKKERLMQEPIYLIVRTPLRLDWMVWRYALENQPLGDFMEIRRSNLDASGWIALEIPSDKKGILEIDVQGKPHNPDRKGNIWLPKIIVFRP